jgi:hypothetical protein
MNLLRIERGNPDEVEVAALVAVLALLSERTTAELCDEVVPDAPHPS